MQNSFPKMLQSPSVGNQTPKRFGLSPAQRVSIGDAIMAAESKDLTIPSPRVDEVGLNVFKQGESLLFKNSTPNQSKRTSVKFQVPLARPEWDSRSAPKTEKTRTNLTPRPVKTVDSIVNPLRGLDISQKDGQTLLEIHSQKIKKLEALVSALQQEVLILKNKQE